jgi:hypothetical protein
MPPVLPAVGQRDLLGVGVRVRSLPIKNAGFSFA